MFKMSIEFKFKIKKAFLECIQPYKSKKIEKKRLNLNKKRIKQIFFKQKVENDLKIILAFKSLCNDLRLLD